MTNEVQRETWYWHESTSTIDTADTQFKENNRQTGHVLRLVAQ